MMLIDNCDPALVAIKRHLSVKGNRYYPNTYREVVKRDRVQSSISLLHVKIKWKEVEQVLDSKLACSKHQELYFGLFTMIGSSSLLVAMHFMFLRKLGFINLLPHI